MLDADRCAARVTSRACAFRSPEEPNVGDPQALHNYALRSAQNLRICFLTNANGCSCLAADAASICPLNHAKHRVWGAKGLENRKTDYAARS